MRRHRSTSRRPPPTSTSPPNGSPRSKVPASRRAALIGELTPLVVDPADHPWGAWQSAENNSGDRLPGVQSRWSAGKDLSFVTLDPVLVVEVGYDHMEGTRLRHTAQFKRWRPDRDPTSCGYDQLEEPVGYELGKILTTREAD